MTFHNIFSKEKTSEVKEIIIIDHREKNSLVPSELVKRSFKLDWQQIAVGDYIIKGIIIERKTFSDLQSSIINKRIFTQLANMPKENSLLIIEGVSERILTEQAIQGFLLACALDFKIPFILTKDEAETASYLTRIALRKPSQLSLQAPKPKTFREQQQFILESFPGIGPKTAEKLLKEFKTLQNVFKATEKELLLFLGKKTPLILKLLHTSA